MILSTSVQSIVLGYGAALIGRFVRAETAHGVIIVGGLPTELATATLSSSMIQAIADIYTKNGGKFIALPNHSLYAIQDFFNGPYHLVQPCQYLNSIAIGYLLGEQLDRLVLTPGQSVVQRAKACPEVPTSKLYAINAAR